MSAMFWIWCFQVWNLSLLPSKLGKSPMRFWLNWKFMKDDSVNTWSWSTHWVLFIRSWVTSEVWWVSFVVFDQISVMCNDSFHCWVEWLDSGCHCGVCGTGSTLCCWEGGGVCLAVSMATGVGTTCGLWIRLCPVRALYEASVISQNHFPGYWLDCIIPMGSKYMGISICQKVQGCAEWLAKSASVVNAVTILHNSKLIFTKTGACSNGQLSLWSPSQWQAMHQIGFNTRFAILLTWIKSLVFAKARFIHEIAPFSKMSQERRACSGGVHYLL